MPLGAALVVGNFLIRFRIVSASLMLCAHSNQIVRLGVLKKKQKKKRHFFSYIRMLPSWKKKIKILWADRRVCCVPIIIPCCLSPFLSSPCLCDQNSWNTQMQSSISHAKIHVPVTLFFITSPNY